MILLQASSQKKSPFEILDKPNQKTWSLPQKAHDLHVKQPRTDKYIHADSKVGDKQCCLLWYTAATRVVTASLVVWIILVAIMLEWLKEDVNETVVSGVLLSLSEAIKGLMENLILLV